MTEECRFGRRFTLDKVILLATQVNDPLHSNFNWNDSSAAQAHRQNQARDFIGRFAVTFNDNMDPIPAFVPIDGSDGVIHYYVVEDVLASQSLRKAALKQMIGALAALRHDCSAFLAAVKCVEQDPA